MDKNKITRLLLICGILILVNYFLLSVNDDIVIRNLDGTIVQRHQMNALNLRMLFINIPLIGLFLSLIFSFIPYKKLSWSKKYFPVSFLIMIFFYSLLILSNVIRFFS